MLRPTARCQNLNHRRSDAPVRACPMCGEVVNPRVPPKACLEIEHAKRRREMNAYCVDCGVRLAT